jgi:hypothetical protein
MGDRSGGVDPVGAGEAVDGDGPLRSMVVGGV